MNVRLLTAEHMSGYTFSAISCHVTEVNSPEMWLRETPRTVIRKYMTKVKETTNPDIETDKTSSTSKSGITLRAIGIGLLLVALVCFIVSYAELVIQRIQIGFLQMPPVVIGIFFFLILLNKGMRRIRQRFGLSAGELMTLYCMMLVAAMISSRGLMERLIPLLVTPNYFANPANQWKQLFYPHIKPWLVPFDVNGNPNQFVATRFYEGLRAGETIPWSLWITPLLVWGCLALVIIFAFLCLATILRRQWVDNEKLSFPLVQPPLELVREEQGKSILQSPLLWGGMALPVLVFGFNGLHNWFPNIPGIPLTKNLNEFLVNPPWNQMFYTPMYVSFAAIGFFFLLPSDLLFALWFFFVLSRIQGVIAASFGMQMDGMPMYPCHLIIGYQVAGAYVILSAYLLYISMPHLKKVYRAAFRREKVDDSQELMPYSVATWGLIICLALGLLWCYLAGMSLWVAILELGVFIFIIAIVMARSTAEAGMLMTETSFRPVDLYKMFAPVHTLGPANMTMLSFLDAAFLRDQRGLILTGFLDGLKISDGTNVRRRAFLPAFIIAIILAMLVAGGIQLYLPYAKGAVTMYYYPYQANNLWGFNDYQPFMKAAGLTVDWRGPTFFAVGAIFTVFLSYMRATFYWWPLHPLGYALCGSWTMIVFWFPCLIAWILKTLILRYGGMRLYIKARPWFFGMVLGEFGMAVIWALVSALTGAPTPEFPWP